MATRPPTISGITGTRRPPTNPNPRQPRVYEDFQPKFEWKHLPGSDILLVYLPGFTRQQIKVTTESSGTIKIHGERPLGYNNKWSRLINQDYPIPENCSIGSITGKFEGGVLSITLPKTTPTLQQQPQPTPTPTPPQPTPTTQQRPPPPPPPQPTPTPTPTPTPPQPTPTTQQRPPPPPPPQPTPTHTHTPTPTPPQPTPTTQQRPTPPPPPGPKQVEDTNKKTINKGQKIQDQDETTKPPKGDQEENTKPAAAALHERTGNVVGSTSDEANDDQKKRSKKFAGEDENKESDEESNKFIAAKEKENKIESGIAMNMNEEERKALVNMGVAGLVIVALGAYYISYTIGKN